MNTSGSNIDRPQIWFEDDNGVGSVRGFGFDRWFARGGFKQGPDLSAERVRCVVDGDAVPYVWDPPNENNAADRNDVPPVLFNGDFDLPDLDRGISEVGEANSMAGWRYFGGGGSALVRPAQLPGAPQPANSWLELHDSALVARHNRFFLPPETREWLFALAVDHIPNVGTHALEVRIGNDVVRRFSINELTDGFEVRRV